MKRYVIFSRRSNQPDTPQYWQDSPPALDHPSPRTGLRTIAVLEATKGVLVLLTAFGLLSLLHRDVGAMAVHLVHGLHLNPDHRYPLLFLQAASQVTDTRLLILVEGALAYATVRFIEAYGLWHQRAWAEWLGLLSGSLYLPWEFYTVSKHATLSAEVVLLLNLTIVLYLLSCRLEAWKTRDGLAVSALATDGEQGLKQSG
jgi:uncharacterized membrane protein (DUF2068 family)